MEMKFKVIEYANTSNGQQQKINEITALSAKGWEIVSETINQSAVDPVAAGRDAACLCFLCGPFCTPFLMNSEKYKTKSKITVTLQRSIERKAEEEIRSEKALKATEAALIAKSLNESATIEAILKAAKEELGIFYPDRKITEAISKYLSETRNAGGAVPSYPKCKKEDGFIIIADGNGTELSRQQIT